ncbi:MAG: type II toxin-antitoxin system RelE/ParE family toxin [Methylococcales bacterium]|nr:type II toxin-antitoxin system RelE/ParE family toxin [Methylococcales bacterium]MDP3840913.1 type II toxin-antitoxin system RelE/ParE family toxin [Methylococcales bacterium]
MKWNVKIDKVALKALAKITKKDRDRILQFLKVDLLNIDNPRSNGKALQGDLKGLWRYRVGDYRLIAQIHDNELVILVIEIGHRKDVYN